MRNEDGSVTLNKKEVAYIKKEMTSYFLRRKQIKRYIQKVHGILNGWNIEEVEKKYPPIKNIADLRRQNKDEKRQDDGEGLGREKTSDTTD